MTPLVPSVLVPVPTVTNPLLLPAPLSITNSPDSDFVLDPDRTVTEPPEPVDFSPTFFPANKFSDPPVFPLEPLSMDIEPPDNSPDPDNNATFPPDPVVDEPDVVIMSPPSP